MPPWPRSPSPRNAATRSMHTVAAGRGYDGAAGSPNAWALPLREGSLGHPHPSRRAGPPDILACRALARPRTPGRPRLGCLLGASDDAAVDAPPQGWVGHASNVADPGALGS